MMNRLKGLVMKQKAARYPRFLSIVITACIYFIPAAALAAGCSASCSGTDAQVAHCQTSSGTESCPSTQAACSAQNCPGGCTGSFFLALGAAESNNNYGTVNGIGCAGQWQFCDGAMSSYGLKYCNSEQYYLANVNNCQDQAEIAYQEGNLSTLQSMGVTAAIGRTIDINGTSFTITEAGLLGAAQLGGPGCAQDLVQGGGNATDQGGTSCRQYFANFNNTTLPSGFPIVGSSGSNNPAGCGGANPSSASAGGEIPAGSPDSGLSSMLPMMMMSSMMSPMMSAMSGLGSGTSGLGASSSAGAATSGASTSSSLDNLVSSLGASLSGGSSTPAASATPAATTAPPMSPVSEDLNQLEQQSTDATDPIAQDTVPAPAAAKDYRLSCGSKSADSVAGCRSYAP